MLSANGGSLDYVAYKPGDDWIFGDSGITHGGYVCQYDGGFQQCGIALDLLCPLDRDFPLAIHLPYHMYDGVESRHGTWGGGLKPRV